MDQPTRRAGVLPGVLAVLAVLAAGCGTDPGGAGSEPTASPSEPASEAPSPTVSVPVFDDDHAMDAPPPLEGPLVPADILVYATEPLSKDVVRRIRSIKGVFQTEQLSLASASIENKVFVIGAVDPASYRRFTLSGKQDEIWARVAGGELAVPRGVAEGIQTDEAFVKLGPGKDAPDVHVGAYASQAGSIDMVVNEKWGEDLFEVHDNALLISTFKTAPQAVRKPLQRIVGDQASIQMLDVVARLGLDPDTVQTAVPTGGSVGAAVGTYHYRVAGGRVIPDAGWVAANIRTEVVPLLGSVTCHKAMLPQLRAALIQVVQSGLGEHVYQTAGCYNARFIANTTRLSNHAFGMAIDINSLENQRGGRGQMHPEVVRIFKNWGFAWGGDWGWTDPMHFEMNRLVAVR
jgi:hypothetical protein